MATLPESTNDVQCETATMQARLPYLPVAKYATYEGQHGIAYRNTDGGVWFLPDHEDTLTLLHNEDIPDLILHGDLRLIAAQRFQDERFGSLYALIDWRNTEKESV